MHAQALLAQLRQLQPLQNQWGTFFVGDTPLVGLLRLLQTHVYAPIVHRRGAGRGTCSSSVQYGRRVDSEIDAYVSTGARPRTKHARSIVGALASRGLRLLATQVAVADADTRVVAIIDGVAADAAGNPVFVEWKTGYEASYVVAQGNMRGCMSGVPNSYRHRHALQVLAARLIVQKVTGVDADSIVVVANTRGVRVWQVDARVRRAGAGLLQQISTRHEGGLDGAREPWSRPETQ